MARIPSVVADVANVKDEQTYVGRPVRAFTGSNMADAANSLLLWRHLRKVSSTFTATDVGAETTQSTTYRVRWVSSPGAQYVWIGFFPYATEPAAGSGGTQSVEATLFTTAGVLIDGPIYWRNTPGAPGNAGHGLLPMIGGPTAGVRAAVTPFAQTGWSTPVDSTYFGPRLLDLAANQAVDVEVRLLTANVRIYSATIIEAFRPEVT